MAWPEVPEDLLAGPRGRRLCFEVMQASRDYCWIDSCPSWRGVLYEAAPADPDRLAAELTWLVSTVDLDAVAATSDPAALLEPLRGSVDSAMYWQPPDGEDQALALPQVAETLTPVATAITAAPATRWWSSLLDRRSQYYVRLLVGGADPGLDSDPPRLAGAAANLESWLADTLACEVRAADLPSDSEANYSGHWWSAPALSNLVSTSRALPGFGPVGRVLVEDAPGYDEVIAWPLAVAADASVYEIRGPHDWADLTARYPVDVAKSRRHDWWRVTGWTGDWVIPNFAAMAADYDALHLTVGGYLTTAGRAIQTRAGTATMLAGWDPDKTYWLSDVLESAGRPVRWVNPDADNERLTWLPVSEPGAGPP